jgi:predicted metal-dependent phosphoesterase TrpH
MTPRAIIEKAASLGLNIIGICDHNTAENVAVTEALGKTRGIRVIPGMEITSAEEVHILGLFDSVGSVMGMQSTVYQHLQPGENDDNAFGMQVVVNEEDEVLGFNRRLLIGSTDLSVNHVVERIHDLGGIAIASHIDREGFGIIGQLGFIPADAGFDGLEISHRTSPADAAEQFGPYRSLPWIISSDAHRIDEIGRGATGLFMHHATFGEFRLTLRGEGQRRILP